MADQPDPGALASDLREVLGRLVRRMRAEHGFPLSHGAVLGRLDREGQRTISRLAAAEGVRPQSMAQTVRDLEEQGFVARHPDPDDRRQVLLRLTTEGRAALEADRRQRIGWLAGAIADGLSAQERGALARAVPLLRRLSERG